VTDRPYDVAVVGLGAVGSCALWQLARRGARVVGFDREAPPHTLGSTHGRTRIIREAYFEHPSYVPLVQRAYDLWAELESATGSVLHRRTGGWMVGPAGGVLVRGARESAERHGLPHEVLDAPQARSRVPGFAIPDHMVALTEPRAGILFPERCVENALAVARRLGAEILTLTRVESIDAQGGAVSVVTATGTVIAKRAIIAAGPWLPSLVRDLPLPLHVERQLAHWFAPARHAERFDADHAPVAIWEFEPGRLFYTIPDVGHGVKIAVHHEGLIVDPDGPRQPPTPEETEMVRDLLARFLPDAAGPLLDRTTCLYTNTPDQHFLIDHHPGLPEVLIASPCSGHGFKFASAVGEAIGEIVLDGRSRRDLSAFTFRERPAVTA